MSNRKISLLKLRILDFTVLLFPILSTALRWLQNRGSSISRQKLLVFVLIGTTFYFLLSNGVSADTLGQTANFNVDKEYDYAGRTAVSATLRKVSDRAYWYVADDYWSNASSTEKDFFTSELEKLAVEFDIRIYPIETSFWGPEWNPGIDNESRITVFLTRLVEKAGGYYDTSNQYAKVQSSQSNEREMVFINTAGVLSGRAKTFLAHEFQHLISFNQKDRLNNLTEDIWLNEARSEYSVKLLGYDDDFQKSNLRRRLIAFLQSPSEPLGEWKNLGPDYGAITLFAYYLTDHYGDKVLVDSLKLPSIGIESLDQVLRLNGFSETFSDIFTNWTIANALNDSSVGPQFGYKSKDLAALKIAPTQAFGVSGFGTNISVFNTVKDWQPIWYEFNTSIGWDSNLKIDFSGSAGSKFKVPYVIFHINGKKEIGFMNISGNSGTSFIENFGDEVYKVILIPANHSKVSGFGDNDANSSFNLNIQVVSEIPKASPIPVPSPTPSVPTVQSVQMILDQIKSLQKQISGLQNQQNSPPASPFSLIRDLFIGSTGDDVNRLQEFLAGEGVYPEARITGYFGSLTRAAVIRFQQKHGIFPQIGYIGAKTRAKIRELVQ